MRAPPTAQTVMVENRPDANGGIAINALISSPANSQTFVVAALSMLRELQLAAGSRLPGGA
jgi:tripartite-type tricarboxylate transporter receptor subunit TctC